MFALFEAGCQVVRTRHTPRFGFASRGANHVAPLRGADVLANRVVPLRDVCAPHNLEEVEHG
jgi:hypothetical protein